MATSAAHGLDVLVVGPLACPIYGPADGPGVPWPSTCPRPDMVIAVDGGYDRCRERGWAVDILVGDFDSLSSEGARTAAESGVETLRLPVDKDRSDVDVALEIADERGATNITVVGMTGGRLDHQLAVLGSLSSPRTARIVALGQLSDAGQPADNDLLHVLRAGDSVSVAPGATFSVMALGVGAVVSVEGARWPLDRHSVGPLSSLGLSNESLEAGARVDCHDGIVVVIVPPPVR